jgi:hypothetical protein
MKANFKPHIFFVTGYIDLSEQLRNELELKIDELYAQNRFIHYVSNQTARIENTTKSDFLCAYLLSKAPKDYVLSGKLLNGIKTWFSMYYDDRLSVIDKFRACYQSVIPSAQINDKRAATIAFCKFLISELLGLLAESRWHDLVNYAD